jgi:GntR family transcriptional repressor for pyruvate dehydrogenase complex
MNDEIRASLHAVRKRRASQDVVAQIQDLLVSGRIRPGDRLPAERELAETLQVGRSTIREAYRALEALGFIRVQPGAATSVAEPPMVTRLVPVNGTAPHGAWNHQRQLFEVRLVLDPPVAALAARRATPEQLEKIRAVLEKQERDLADGGSGLEADTQFHTLLFDAAGNSFLGDIADQVTALLGEHRAHFAAPDRGVLSLTQHRRIFQAVESRNPKVAERRMRAHLHSIAELVLDPSRTTEI